MRQPQATSLDVLAHAFDFDIRRERLLTASAHEIETIMGVLDSFYRSWSLLSPFQADEIAGSLGRTDDRRPELVCELALYLDRVVIEDPLEAWLIEEGRIRAGLVSPPYKERNARRYYPTAAQRLAAAYQRLACYRECIEAGAVVPVPRQWNPLERPAWPANNLDEGYWLGNALARNPAFARSVLGSLPVSARDWARYDEDRDSYTDALSPNVEKSIEAALSTVEGQAWTVASSIEYAARTGARFIPLDAIGEAALVVGLHQMGKHTAAAEGRIDMKVVAAIASGGVPVLQNVDSALTARLRDEPGFADWRRLLRQAVTTAANLEDPDASRSVEDSLMLAVRGVQKEVSRSAALKTALKDEWRTTAIELPVWAGVAAAVPAGRFLTAGRIAGGIASVLSKGMAGHRDPSAAAVVVKLLRRTR